MTSSISPELLTEIEKLQINLPCYIRKINNRNHWNGLEGNINQRVQQAVEKNFNEQGNIYSLWCLETKEQFLGIVACLTTYAHPKRRNIDFICIKKQDLQQAKINLQGIPEGRCIYVEKLHFNAQVNKKEAEKLSSILINKGIEAQRCPKKLTEGILAYQEKLGCLATNLETNSCSKKVCM